jgi:pimeloyl-ACP methyl ester carboxylesterase
MFRRAGNPPAAVLKQVPDALAYDLARESFQVFVPAVAPPAAGWGLLVWISPGPFGGTLRPETQALLAQRGLIWVGANAAGNDRVRWDRWGLALDAAWHAQKLYAVDPERIYVAGYSGGGRAASALTLLYPDVFRAGLMVMGVDWYRDLPVPDQPGAHWPAPFDKPPRDLLRLARERSRFVLLTGERDFNRAQTRVVRAELENDGFRTVTYLEVPAISHYDPVPGEWLARAYAALDGAPPLASTAAGR